MVIYMKVTDDEFELPVIIADSASELAAKTGVGRSTITSAISHAKRYNHKSVYVRVVID